MRGLSALLAGLVAFGLSACTTVPKGPEDTAKPEVIYPSPDVENPGAIIIAQPEVVPSPPPVIPAPPPPPSEPPAVEVFEQPKWYNALAHWDDADTRPALASFKRSCESFAKANPNALLNPNLPEYGRYGDWLKACTQASRIGPTASQSRQFFEAEFEPMLLLTNEGDEGLLTGYYEPEIDVRKTPTQTYFEPILAKPTSKSVQNLPRAKLNAASSRVIAYGRPIDVFFMQIQGSGRIKYANGKTVRAAYGGNNGRAYKSIGRVLIQRGEMTKEQASKQAIEGWMARNGPAAARELMNQNPRYIFFAEQAILEGEGPRGSMRVPLTKMGSMAVDNSYHPYGTLIWLTTTLPQAPGDYRGKAAGILVSAQDSGSAIKGPLRGDLFFGAGKQAGDKAGVMKHPVQWTILVPKSIAPNSGPSS